MLPGPPKAPKLSPTWSSCRYHGPSWAQVAANLVHLGPSFAPTLPKISTSRQKPQEAPPDLPRPPRGSRNVFRVTPRARIFMVLGSMLELFFKDFPSVSLSIYHGLFASSSARWWLSAAPAKRWSGVCESGIQSCQFQFPTLRKGSGGSAARAQVAMAARISTRIG